MGGESSKYCWSKSWTANCELIVISFPTYLYQDTNLNLPTTHPKRREKLKHQLQERQWRFYFYSFVYISPFLQAGQFTFVDKHETPETIMAAYYRVLGSGNTKTDLTFSALHLDTFLSPGNFIDFVSLRLPSQYLAWLADFNEIIR